MKVKVNAGFRDRRLVFVGRGEGNIVDGLVSAMELETVEPHPERRIPGYDERARTYEVLTAGPDELRTQANPGAWKDLRLAFNARTGDQATPHISELAGGVEAVGAGAKALPDGESLSDIGASETSKAMRIIYSCLRRILTTCASHEHEIARKCDVTVERGDVLVFTLAEVEIARVSPGSLRLDRFDQTSVHGHSEKIDALHKQIFGLYGQLESLAVEERVRMNDKISRMRKELIEASTKVILSLDAALSTDISSAWLAGPGAAKQG